MAEDIRITGENAQCVYYCSRMISAQYGTEFVKSNYQNVRVGLGKPDGENYDGVLKMLGALFSGENIITEKKRILEQTMDAMQLPTADRPKYAEMLKLQRVRTFTENDIPNGSWQHEILTTSIGDIALVTRKP